MSNQIGRWAIEPGDGAQDEDEEQRFAGDSYRRRGRSAAAW